VVLYDVRKYPGPDIPSTIKSNLFVVVVAVVVVAVVVMAVVVVSVPPHLEIP
jgi:hypothetical protein